MANGLVLRQDVDALSDSELAALRDAYEKMMQITDNRGYNYWAGVHGVPQNYCWHGGSRFIPGTPGGPYNLFLPWHRAYILYFEHAARDQDSSAVLPWWDWTSTQSHTTGVPTAFSAETVNGQTNPLYKSHITVPSAQPPLDRDTQRFPGDPSELPASTDVEDLYSVTQFEEFSSRLEDIHNFIHGWTGGVSTENGRQVGGDMGVIATAAYDPIFWSHHCMIDRIWYLWQLRNGVNNIPADYLSVILTPFRFTVKDVLNIGALGYEYAVTGVTVEA